MIEVRNLSKSYSINGKRISVFKNISFKINTGESVAILGRNGAGKSTLLRIIGGVDLPDSGEVITDKSISWPVGLKGGFQGSLSAKENIIFITKMFLGSDKEKIKEKVRFVREFAEIGKYFDKPFKTYSTGMRSRVTFGASMAFKFDIYLIDEISAAGDQSFRKKCENFLEKKLEESDFIMVNHNLWSLRGICKRAFILEKGELVEYNNLEEAIEVHKKQLFISRNN